MNRTQSAIARLAFWIAPVLLAGLIFGGLVTAPDTLAATPQGQHPAGVRRTSSFPTWARSRSAG